MEKEWTITLDVPEHFVNDTFTVHELIAGLGIGAFHSEDLPFEAREKIREEVARRGRTGDEAEELRKYMAKKPRNLAGQP